jgi:hypothetical protein
MNLGSNPRLKISERCFTFQTFFCTFLLNRSKTTLQKNPNTKEAPKKERTGTGSPSNYQSITIRHALTDKHLQTNGM